MHPLASLPTHCERLELFAVAALVGGMATVEQIKELMKEQKAEFVQSVKSELASMKDAIALAKELWEEKQFVQVEISKS